MFKKVAFTYYPVTDVARARKFYEETLGLKSGSAPRRGAGHEGVLAVQREETFQVRHDRISVSG
jgi:extradiol dioxygenase family protein